MGKAYHSVSEESNKYSFQQVSTKENENISPSRQRRGIREDVLSTEKDKSGGIPPGQTSTQRVLAGHREKRVKNKPLP
jgi:hypothetical protein